MICRRKVLQLAASGVASSVAQLYASAATDAQSYNGQHLSGDLRIFRGQNVRAYKPFLPGPRLDQPIVVKWHISFDDGAFALLNILVFGNTIYVSSSEYLYAVDMTTGLELWRLNSSTWFSQVAFADNVLIVNDATGLFGVDASLGIEKWRVKSSQSLQSLQSLPMIDGTVFGCSDSDVFSISYLSGERRWQYTTQNRRISFLQIEDEVLYVSGDPYFYALSIESGEPRWQFPADGEQLYTMPIMIINGTVYVSTDSRLYALDGNSGTELWHIDAVSETLQHLDDSTFLLSEEQDLYAVDTGSGSEVWRFTADLKPALAAVAEESTFIRVGRELFALRIEDGTEIWRFAASSDFGVRVADGVVICTTETSIYALDSQSGQEIWHLKERGRMFRAEEDITYLSDQEGHGLYALDTTSGTEVWRFAINSGVVVGSMLIQDEVIYLTTFEDGLLSVYALGNYAEAQPPSLIRDTVIQGAPSNSGVERGTAYAHTMIDSVGAREANEGRIWIEVTIGDMTGWIPLNAIEPATLPPDVEIEYLYIPE